MWSLKNEMDMKKHLFVYVSGAIQVADTIMVSNTW